MARLFEPPPTFELPLSKGNDILFNIVYKPLLVDENNQPILDGSGKKQYVVTDYPPGATVQVVIEAGTEPVQLGVAPMITPRVLVADIVIDATITGSVARVWGQSEEADQAAAGLLWRAVVTYEDGLDKVLCNGMTGRYDGS